MGIISASRWLTLQCTILIALAFMRFAATTTEDIHVHPRENEFTFKSDVLKSETFSALSQNVSGGDAHFQNVPNWSVFEVSAEQHEVQNSINVVKSIPVQHFWDFHKGHFKFGILGESVEDFYPNFVTNSRIKFSIDSASYNLTSANTEIIFSHLVLVVQYLAVKIAGELGTTVKELLAENDNFALKIIRIANETGIEWRTANEIRTSREVIEIKKQIIEAEILRAVARDGYRNGTAEFYNVERKLLLEAQHGHILEAIAASQGRQAAVDLEKHQELMMLSETTENKHRETQISILQHRHISSLDRLAVDVQLGIKAVKFRAAEEGRVDRENEDLALHIMQAKGESLRKGFEEIVTMVHLKVTVVVQDAFDNPAFVMKCFSVVAAAMSLYIVLLEIAQAFRAYLTSKVTSPAVLKEAWGRKDSPSPEAHQHLVVSSECAKRLESMSHVYEMVLKSRAERTAGYMYAPPPLLLLPNVLIVGPPGTGKSMSAQMLARQSGFPYIVVCGGDLLAVGNDSTSLSADLGESASSSAPGRYLRDVLHGASAANRGHGFLVILDEVESIIADRGSRRVKVAKKQQPESTSADDGEGEGGAVALESKECIHILLNMLRLNSAALGVIINTSLKLQHVDPALLDRMDRVVTLELPDASLRLTQVVRYAKDLLGIYVQDTVTRGHLETLCAHGNMSLAACTEEAFVSAMQFVLGNEVDVAHHMREGAIDLRSEVKGEAKVDTLQVVDEAEKRVTRASAKTPAKRKGRESKTARGEEEPCASDKQEGVMCIASPPTSTSTSTSSSASFNLFVCLFRLVACSAGWSHREIAKVVQNILSDVIATEECVLSTVAWMRQVQFKVMSKATSGA